MAARRQAGAATGAENRADWREQIEATRRRLGLAMLAIGVVLIGLQGLFEWLLPYDPAGADWLAAQLGWSAQPAVIATAWMGLVLAALALLAWAGARAAPALRDRAGVPPLAVAGSVAGALLGSAQFAAGGAAPALALLTLGGVATLGWQSWRAGGGGLFFGAALVVALGDALLSTYPTLWAFCAALVALFGWIERRHIQASDRRLFGALAERDRLIADLDQRSAELAALQKARTQMLASISHDLRQPLAALRLYADALAAQPQGDAARTLLDGQRRASDDAVAMLDQFSEFSAIEQGQLVLQPEDFEALAVLQGIAATLARMHPQCRIGVRGRPQGLSCDRTHFARIVQNLAGNAVRHAGAPAEPARAAGTSGGAQAARTASDARVPRVLLALRRDAGGLRVQVYDNGPGIPAGQLSRIFEPYVQLAGAKPHAGGRGLGLAIVRGLAAALGASVAVVSTPGRGSRFELQLPAELLRDRAPLPPADAAPRGSAFYGRMFALLDDEDGPRQALAAALRARGAHVVEAASLGALQALLDDELRFPDALLFDLDLRDEIDGLAAVAHLRQAWGSDVPALVITGRAGATMSLRLPPKTRLRPKPVGLDDIAAALDGLLPVRTAA